MRTCASFIHTTSIKWKCVLTMCCRWGTSNETIQKNETETKITIHPVYPLIFFASNSVLAILHYLYTFGNVTFCLGCVLTTKYNSEDSMNNSDSLRGLDGRDQFQTSVVFKGGRTFYRKEILKAKSMNTYFLQCVSVIVCLSDRPYQISVAFSPATFSCRCLKFLHTICLDMLYNYFWSHFSNIQTLAFLLMANLIHFSLKILNNF